MPSRTTVMVAFPAMKPWVKFTGKRRAAQASPLLTSALAASGSEVSTRSRVSPPIPPRIMSASGPASWFTTMVLTSCTSPPNV